MKKNHRKIFYPLIFFLGIISMYFQIEIFRNTIINWLIPASIIVIIGVIVFFIDFKNYKKTYFHYTAIKLFALGNYLIGYGFITCSLFMFVNFHFADKNQRTESYKIIDQTYIRKSGIGKEQPVFKIEYNGQKKELVFKNKYFDKMKEYKTIEFSIRKGFFGFDILESKKLNL